MTNFTKFINFVIVYLPKICLEAAINIPPKEESRINGNNELEKKNALEG